MVQRLTKLLPRNGAETLGFLAASVMCILWFAIVERQQ